MKLTVEIQKHTYPRKSDEYSVRIMDGEKYFCNVRPMTPYKAEADMVKLAFEALLMTEDGESAIRKLREELP